MTSTWQIRMGFLEKSSSSILLDRRIWTIPTVMNLDKK